MRAPRRSNGTPAAAYSWGSQPIPSPTVSRPPDSRSRDVIDLASSAGAVNGAQTVAVPSPIRSVWPATYASGTNGSCTARYDASSAGRVDGLCTAPYDGSSPPSAGTARAGTSTATRTPAPRRVGRRGASCRGSPNSPTPAGRTRAAAGHRSQEPTVPGRRSMPTTCRGGLAPRARRTTAAARGKLSGKAADPTLRLPSRPRVRVSPVRCVSG